MKTKLLLTSMVLPALFAACTADEFANGSEAGVQGRALLGSNFTITVNGTNTADTRFSWNEDNYEWNPFTQEDKFSAGLVDNVDGTIQDKVQTNYVFSSADGTSFTTTSQMVEGAYLFYSKPGFEESASRSEVTFDLSGQVKTNLNKPDSLVNANQLFVTELYRLDAETANEPLGLTFRSYWSTAAIRVKNTSGNSFKIVRMILSDATDRFAIKGKISPDKMEDAGLIYAYDKEAGAYVINKNAKDILVEDIAAASPTKVSELVIECQNFVLDNGKEVTAYMQVPAGLYQDGNMTLKMAVEVTDQAGVKYVKELEKAVVAGYTDGDGTKYARFRRGHTTALFGTEAGAPVAYDIDEIELLTAEDVEGLYASSYQDMYNYLTDATNEGTVSEPVEINNLSSLKLDNQLISLMTRMGKYVSFTNAIDIESVSAAEVSLDKVTFKGGATLTKGIVNFGSDAKVTDKLTVNSGANAIVSTATGISAITNNGTVTMAVNPTSALNVTNGEKANMVINNNITINTSNLVLSTMPKTLTVNKGKILTVTATTTIAYGQTWTNNGTITGTNLTNKGTIDNNGTINTVINEGADATPNDKIAVINNYSKITAATLKNYSKVYMKDALASVAITSDASGAEVDNTIGGFVSGGTNTMVYAAYSGNQSGELGKVSGCNAVLVDGGTWTNPSVYTGVKTVILEGVALTHSGAITFGVATKIEMNGGSVAKDINFSAATEVTAKNVTFSGAATFTAATTLNIDGSTFNGAMNAAANGLTALTLKGVTFNNTVTATQYLTSLTIAAPAQGESYAAMTKFMGEVTATGLTSLTVNEKAELYVALGVTLGNSDHSSTTVTNNGTVYNYGTVHGNAGSTEGEGWNGNPLTKS